MLKPPDHTDPRQLPISADQCALICYRFLGQSILVNGISKEKLLVGHRPPNHHPKEW